MLMATNSPGILIVDDNEDNRYTLQLMLETDGHERIASAAGGNEAIALIEKEKFSLILLDLMMPDLNGDEVLKVIKSDPDKRDISVVMISADTNADKVSQCIELGADDYLPKPFNPRELLARINAVLRRRAAPLPPGAPAVEPEKVSFGNMTVNLATRTLDRDGQSISLTTGEFALLKVLVTNPRTPLSRDKLMELARGREYEVFDRSIDVQVSRLRKLVEKDPGHPAYIQTVWGFGYVFVPDGAPQ